MQCFHLLCQYRRKSRIRQKPPHHIHPFIPFVDLPKYLPPVFIGKPASDFPSHIQFQRALNKDPGLLFGVSDQDSRLHRGQIFLCQLMQICICIIFYKYFCPCPRFSNLPYIFRKLSLRFCILSFHQIHHLVHLHFAVIVA